MNADKNRRGLQVYTMSQLMAISGRKKGGDMMTGFIEQPIFYLNVDERIGIFRLCAPVNGVVTSRMNRISALRWKVVTDKYNEDKIAERLKNLKQVYDEYSASTDEKYVIASALLRKDIEAELPDLLPDLSNFNKALLRWSRRIKMRSNDDCEQVMQWLMEPNIDDHWEDFLEKYVFDMMIHGATAIYKEALNGKVENLYILPGGTVIPLKNKYVGGAQGFVQILQAGMDPQIYFGDELSYSTYIPSSARNYGYIPLEALINKVSESLMFDKLMAEQADGTRMPEKMVIITDPSPFGDMNKEFNVPIDPDEQKRIEMKMNTPIKGSMMTFSGNDVTVVDLSRENTMAIQMQRQKDIREEVAMVFNASNIEMNLTGSENTSGRETSETQQEMLQNKGIIPIVKKIETQFTKDIIPFRFGPGFRLEADTERSETETVELMQKKMATGIYSINEIRVNELNLDPFDEEQFDKPSGSQQEPNGSESSPFNFKGL